MWRRHFMASIGTVASATVGMIGVDWLILEKQRVPVTVVEKEMMNIEGPSAIQGIELWRDPEVIGNSWLTVWLKPQSVEYGVEEISTRQPDAKEEYDSESIEDRAKVSVGINPEKGEITDLYLRARVDTGIFGDDEAGVEHWRIRVDG